MSKKLRNLLSPIKYHLLPLGAFGIICTVIIMSWFRYGLLYGGGDVGLPTYDPIRLLSIVKNIWWDVHAPGFPYPSALTAIPLYFLLSILQTAGVTSIAMQALLFGILLFFAGAGMYILFFEVMPTKSRILPFVAAIFYMLNPYVVVQVWHRFVHTAFFLTALLPILMFTYIRILKTRKFYWFLGFLISSLLFTYTFGSLSFMIVVWIPIATYSFWRCFEVRNAGSVLEIFKIFILLFLSWVLINAWWLYPFWTTGPAIYSQVHSIYASVSTLVTLSAQSTIPMVLRGLNPFYIFGDEAWVPGYDSLIMSAISWTFPLVVLIGIYSILIYKRRGYYFWILLFLVGVFIAKGTAAPFGHPFLWFFSKSFLLGVFRNPFEKFGIVVPFAAAFIFPIGIEQIYNLLKKHFLGKKSWAILLVSLLLALEFIIYAWPVWRGRIFGSFDQPAVVSVPEDYKKADQWVQDQAKEGRILQLPFATGDAITYFWGAGYNGIEPSSLLFKTPSISQGFGLEVLDNSLGAINAVFTVDNFDQDELANVLSSLDIRYIIVHRDVDWKMRGLMNPEKLTATLSEVDFISERVVFGNLIIYEVNDSVFVSKAFTVDVSDMLVGGSKGFAFWPEIYKFRKLPELFASPINGNEDNLDPQKDLNYSLTPSQIIEIPSYPLAYKENALVELPKPRFLPDSSLYWTILLKERIQLFSSPVSSRHLFELELAGKRLSEIYLLNQKGNRKLAGEIVKKYINQLDIALGQIHQRQISGLIADDELLNLKKIFARHKILLEELEDKETLDSLKLKLSGIGFASYHEPREENGMSKFGRKVYRFDVLKEDDYEILLKSLQNRVYKNGLSEISVQINDRVEILNTHRNGGFLSLGKVRLKKGLNEISYNTVDSVNLVQEVGSDEWIIRGSVNTTSVNGQASYEFNTNKIDETTLSFPLKGFDNNSLYRIDFEYWTKKGQGPVLQVMQDSDWAVKEKRFMSIDKLYDRDNYNLYWNSASIFFEPRINTTEALVRIKGEPWNNCEAILAQKAACLNETVRAPYNRETNFIIRNVSVKRVLADDIFLRAVDAGSDESQNLKEVGLNQLSPSYYEGKLILDGPTSLVLLTTFHSEWKLSLNKDGKTEVVPEERHFLANGYGNLWYLNEDPGEYKIKIEFLPQKRFKRGIALSVAGAIFVLILGIIFSRKKKND